MNQWFKPGFLPYIFVFILLLSACESIRTEAPKAEPAVPLPEAKLSYVNAPVLFPLPELRKKINESLSGTLVNISGKSVDAGKNVTVFIHNLKVKKIENIRLSGQGNLLSYVVPLRVDLDADFSKKIGIKLKMRKQIGFSARFYFHSYVSFSAGRTLYTQTTLERIEWIDEPEVKFGGIAVSLRGRADKLLEAQKDKITQKIDAAALKHLSLDKPISKVWTALQKPILINKKVLKIWLHSRPVGISAMVPMTKHDVLHINLQLAMQNRTLFGENPKIEINRKLPPIKAASDLPDSCEIYLMSPVPFAEINAVLKEKIKDLKLEYSGLEIKLKEAEISAFGPKLLVKLRTGGDLNATLYLYAKPIYDKLARNLYFDEITFDLDTEEALVGTADELLHDAFLELLSEKLHLPLGGLLDKIPEVVDKSLANSKLSQKVDLKVAGLRVEPQAVYVSPEGIAAEVRAKARLEVVLKKF